MEIIKLNKINLNICFFNSGIILNNSKKPSLVIIFFKIIFITTLVEFAFYKRERLFTNKLELN